MNLRLNTLKKSSFFIMNNIFIKSIKSIGKIIFLAVLAYLSLKLFFAENKTQLAIGLFVLIFITLPTIFLFFFFKQKMSGERVSATFAKIWKIYRVFYVIFIVLYAGFWIFGTWHLNEVAKTQKTIDFINSQKITLDDVMGKNLPPQPDQQFNDSTIAGIDFNKNYIRDDVELAIFKKYPNSAKIRAAELQYAQALQLELTQVYSSKTLIPAMQKESRGSDCISMTGPNVSLKDTREKIIAALAITDEREKEVDDFVKNTDLRKKEYSDIFKKYMTGYASLPGNECDIELSLLPN